MDTKDLAFAVNKEWQQYQKEFPWLSFVAEEARDKEGHLFMRKKGGSAVYQKVEDGYQCTTCGSEIQQVEVIHSIWDGPFPMSGSGETTKECIPYCPKCEQKPNVRGTPIRIK